MDEPRLRDPIMQSKLLGVEIEPQHAEGRRGPGRNRTDEAHERGDGTEQPTVRVHRVEVPRPHAERLPAVHPVNHEIPGHHGTEAGTVNVDPRPGIFRQHRKTVREHECAGREDHEHRGEQQAVVNECRDPAPESGARRGVQTGGFAGNALAPGEEAGACVACGDGPGFGGATGLAPDFGALSLPELLLPELLSDDALLPDALSDEWLFDEPLPDTLLPDEPFFEA